jgi:hypothetical protein
MVLIRGFVFGTGDQVIHLPLLYKINEPNLFPGDSIFPVTYSNYTFIYVIVSLINRIVNSYYVTFLGLYLLSNLLLVFLSYLIIKRLSNCRSCALIVPLAFVWQLPVAGSAITTIEGGFTPRLLSNILLLPLLYCLYSHKYSRVFILLGILFLIHPITSVLALCVSVPVIIFLEKKKSVSLLLKGFVIFLIMVSWFIPTFFRNTNISIKPELIDNWIKILKMRNLYAFPLLWSFKSWLLLCVETIPLISILIYKKLNRIFNTNDKISLIVWLTALLLFFIQIIFTSVFPSPLIIRIQISRIWLIPFYIQLGYIMIGIGKLLNFLRVPTGSIKLSIITILLAFTFIKGNQLWKVQPTDWIAAQMWANKHTSSGCTFLVDFYSQGFRVYSKRPIVGEFKDGTLSFYSQIFANEWDAKNQFFNPKQNGGYVKDIPKLRQLYPFSLVVLHNSISINTEKIYSNQTYSIYKIDQTENGCQII